MNNGGNKREIVLQGVGRLVAISVDWLGNNIYYLDQAGGRIGVVSIDGRHQTTLATHLVQPLDLVVDPNTG